MRLLNMNREKTELGDFGDKENGFEAYKNI